MSKIFKAGQVKIQEPVVLPRDAKDKMRMKTRRNSAEEQQSIEDIMKEQKDKYEKIVNDIRSNFEKEKKNLIQKHNSELENMKNQLQQKYRQGLSEGERKGIEQGKKQIIHTDQKLQSIIQEFNEHLYHIKKEQESDLLELIRTICEFVIRKELSLRDDLFIDMLEEVVKTASNKRKIVVKAAKSTIIELKESKDKLIADLDSVKEIEFEADKNLQQGDIIVSTESETLDARVKTMLSEIFEKIYETHYSDHLDEKEN